MAVVFGTALNLTAFMIYHAVWRRAPRALAYTLLVVGWISYEYLYICGEISFPWLTLGNGFAHDVSWCNGTNTPAFWAARSGY